MCKCVEFLFGQKAIPVCSQVINFHLLLLGINIFDKYRITFKFNYPDGAIFLIRFFVQTRFDAIFIQNFSIRVLTIAYTGL